MEVLAKDRGIQETSSESIKPDWETGTGTRYSVDSQ
jgi:hypothetical protein